MTDMHATVIPKSDQTNYDDIPNGMTRTIKITKVSGKSGDQPICINYENDNGKPYYPCKSMRRVLIHNWGGNGNDYVGRSLTLYGDPDVKFGGLAVGGIRISHMSHISKEVTLALTATKASRKPFTVKPMVVAEPHIDHALEIMKRNARDNAINGTENLQKWWTTLPKETQAKLKPSMDEYKKIAKEADDGQKNQIPAGNDSAMGEGLAIGQGDERGDSGEVRDKPDGANTAVEGAGK